jgi:hypothetical protein
MNTFLAHSILIVAFIALGCAGEMRIVSVSLSEKYVTIKSKNDVKVGDILNVYRRKMVEHSGHQHGGSSASPLSVLVGKVKITKIMSETQAAIEVIEGSIEDGDTAEKANS